MTPLPARQLWLADIDPELEVKSGDRTTFVRLGTQVIATIDPHGFRTWPDGRRHVLRLDSGPDRRQMRRLIADRLGLPQPPNLADPETLRVPDPKPARSVLLAARPPEPNGRASLTSRLPTAAEVAAARKVLALHGLEARHDPSTGSISTPVGDVIFTTATSSATSAVESLLVQRAQKDADKVLALVQNAMAGLGVTVSTKKRRVRIHVAKKFVASVTRFFVHVQGDNRTRVDLLKDPSALLDTRSRLQAKYLLRAPSSPRTAKPATPSQRSAFPPHPAAPRAPTVARQKWLRMPAEAPQRLSELAGRASERLRNERRIEMAVGVDVQTGAGDLSFDKLARGKELRAEFRFRSAADEPFAGALVLNARSELIPLYAPVSADRSLVAHAWTVALLVYAELTCPIETPADPKRASPQSIRGGVPRSSPTQRRAAAPTTRARSTRGGRTVRSFAEAVRELQSVAGHVRRLPPGHDVGADAIAAAAAVGIRLPDGCTWVRPHARNSDRITVSLSGLRLW